MKLLFIRKLERKNKDSHHAEKANLSPRGTIYSVKSNSRVKNARVIRKIRKSLGSTKLKIE